MEEIKYTFPLNVRVNLFVNVSEVKHFNYNIYIYNEQTAQASSCHASVLHFYRSHDCSCVVSSQLLSTSQLPATGLNNLIFKFQIRHLGHEETPRGQRQGAKC